MNAEPLLAMVEELLRAAEGARQRPADPDLVLADRMLVEQRVEGDDAFDVSRREIQPVRDPGDDFVRDEAVLILAKVERGNARGHLRRVALEDPIELPVAFGR